MTMDEEHYMQQEPLVIEPREPFVVDEPIPSTFTKEHLFALVGAIVVTVIVVGTGVRQWDRDVIKAYLLTMHTTRPYMPPFPGSDPEAGALADWLVTQRLVAQPVAGAQSAGVSVAPPLPGQGGN